MSGNGFHLYTCNNLEDLAKAYSEARLNDPRRFRTSGVFGKERIAVATRGMGIWLEQALVNKGHVVANVEFPFLRVAINDILRRFKGGGTSYMDMYEEDVLVWRIYGLLMDEGVMSQDEMAVVRGYLKETSGAVEAVGEVAADASDSGDASSSYALRCYQLSMMLAQQYYNYMVFVPELLHPELGSGETVIGNERNGWQLVLWNALAGQTGGETPARTLLEFLKAKGSALQKLGYTPLSFFGISAMPAYFLKILKKVSTVTDVNFFYLNYCDEFWGDVKSDWERRRKDVSGFDDVHETLDEHYNNTLLGNFGLQGRRFFNAVMELDNDIEENWVETSHDMEDSCGEKTLLRELQDSVRQNRNAEMVLPLAADDDSVTIHNCFNMTRQIEVLQDRLLKLLEKSCEGDGPRLALNDIIVMAPNIGDFAASIHAVLDKGPLKGRYCISDRSVRTVNTLSGAWLTLMKLPQSHLEFSRVSSLLETRALRNRFGFDEEDSVRVREWLQKAGACHGDMSNGSEEFTWRRGLDRLLLKLAVDAPAIGDELSDVGFGGLLPVDFSTSGDNMQLLGGLCGLYDALSNFVTEVNRGARSGVAWCDFLRSQREVFFRADSECAEDYAGLGRALSVIEKGLTAAGLDELTVPFDVISTALSGLLQRPAQGEPFLNGKITFCSLMPMRGIPRRVIALLGMDTGAFPRSDEQVGFSLLAPPSGGAGVKGDYNLLSYYDRSRSVEDRYTFLEAMMSAQEHFMMFYNGTCDKYLKPLPASSPLTELLEYAGRFRSGVKEGIVVKHGLNGFDASSFRRGGGAGAGGIREHFSYSKSDHDIAMLGSVCGELARWRDSFVLPFPEPLPFTVLERKSDKHVVLEMRLEELERYLKDASGVYLRTRLGFPWKEWEEEPASDYEVFEVGALEASKIKRAVGSLQRGKSIPWLGNETTENEDIRKLYRVLQADGQLPIGDMGRMELMSLQKDAWIPEETFRNELATQENSDAQEYDMLLEDVPLALPREVTELLGDVDVSPLGRIDVRLRGRFKSWSGTDGKVGIRSCPWSKNEHHCISLYLRHLMLCVATGSKDMVESKLLQDVSEKTQMMNSDVNVEAGGKSSDERTFDASSPEDRLKKLVGVCILGHLLPLPLYRSISVKGGMWLLDSKGNVSSNKMGLTNISDLSEEYVDYLWGDMIRNNKMTWLGVVKALSEYCYGGLALKKE